MKYLGFNFWKSLGDLYDNNDYVFENKLQWDFNRWRLMIEY